MRPLLQICSKLHLHLHPEICLFFAMEINRCGKHNGRDVSKFIPRNMRVLIGTPEPRTCAHLQNFLGTLQGNGRP